MLYEVAFIYSPSDEGDDFVDSVMDSCRNKSMPVSDITDLERGKRAQILGRVIGIPHARIKNIKRGRFGIYEDLDDSINELLWEEAPNRIEIILTGKWHIKGLYKKYNLPQSTARDSPNPKISRLYNLLVSTSNPERAVREIVELALYRNRMDEKDLEVVRYRGPLPGYQKKSRKEVGDMLGISEGVVRRIERDCFNKLLPYLRIYNIPLPPSFPKF